MTTISITDQYRLLFGRSGTNKGSDIDMAEHGRVGGVSTGEPYKKVGIVDGLPIDAGKSNPSLVLTQTDNVVASTKTLTMTIGATPYVATISYNAAGQFLSISAWS